MKKILSATSLALLGVIALTGCSCKKDGTYEFHHIEYQDGGKTETTDCKKTDDLPAEIAMACSLVDELPSYVIDGNKFFVEGEELEEWFFKIEGEKILFAESEDGKYFESELLTYKDGKLYYGGEGTYIVFDN